MHHDPLWNPIPHLNIYPSNCVIKLHNKLQSHLQIPQHPKYSKQCIQISPQNKCSQIHSKLEIEQMLLNSFIPTESQKQLNVFKFIHPDSKLETTNDSKTKNN